MMNLAGLQVQAVANIQDLTSWLNFLHSFFGDLEDREWDMVMALWEGIWGNETKPR